ncbi:MULTISPECIES: SPOR domain-containing protein [unclassified Pseudomonas]|uniref:SPOR domain-containing protein n=1 Tax=unclassified Pseudomonas TaxID=196821 RepID=UPI000D3CE232|nr:MULTISPECIES: SPOR domain-containing protein [unclassified Pseudomonas]RAU43232.1 SPOR domain-containing protein [Pseudomonas sp. RIT 409]RAU50276.1 SPOR domain-containing protein [Pseudomonas sp. RIT 412]
MHSAMLSKTHFNGYDVINVNNGPWRVCTHHDRLGSFETREEAMAFAASLPAYKERTAMEGQAEEKDEGSTQTVKDRTSH